MTPAHYPEVLGEIRESLPGSLKKADALDRDAKGLFTLRVASKLRNLAVVGFLVEKDVSLFRSSLVEATNRRIQLMDRFDAGDPISPSLVSMMTYQELLDALASNDLEAAKALSEQMGGRPAVEQEHDSDFEIAIGYALKAILADDDAAALTRLDDLERSSTHKDYVSFAGYVPVLRAIVLRNSAALEAAFPDLLAGHRRASKGNGLFSGGVDEFLCVWGIGLINLAGSRGMVIKVDDPLIPAELIL
jgi:hypothetical protein